MLAGPLVALLARGLATEWPPLWLVLLVGALAAGWAFAPESVIGAVALLVVGFSWATGLEGRLPIAAVLAAAAMLAAHLAALVASYGPDALPVSAPRGAVVGAPRAPGVPGRVPPCGRWVAGSTSCPPRGPYGSWDWSSACR